MKKRWLRIGAGLLAGVLLCAGLGWQVKVPARAAGWELIEAEVPAWKTAVTEALGVDVIAGLAATQSELNDKGVFELITKHANAVTFGNELKPDCMFGYSNDTCPGKEEITFQGRKLLVPKPTFSRADKMLEKLKAWNDENPDNAIKIRGHVLVWHSQTPEWFFHEDYDKKNDYVDKDTMNLRLEWYIKTVLEHYLGEESPYREMFYGWDVVNEAASDGANTYRSDTENGSDKLTDSTHGSKSSWWHVYESNEFIINAFRYANKYAPADVELYYNDYNDIVPTKREHIKELLAAVKNADGTRIDGFGMQAHYSVRDFNLAEFETSAREYAAIVGAVQLTELDLKASATFDGTPATLDAEYLAQAKIYQSLFESMKKLSAEGVRFSGITFWGTVDKFSWLQSQSHVGGGADGKQTQCPLMFDNDYRVKPAFWAFVDPSRIMPLCQKLQAVYDGEASFKNKPKYEWEQGAVSVSMIPIWNQEGLLLQLSITDRSDDAADEVTVFVDETDSRKESAEPVIVTQKRADCKKIAGGYKAELQIPIEDIAVGRTIGFDVRVVNGEEQISYNDFRNLQEKDSTCYAEMTMKPQLLSLVKGTAEVDGEREEIWKGASILPLTVRSGAATDAKVKALWDEQNLYLYAQVKDDAVGIADGVGICIDEKNEKLQGYDENDLYYFIDTQGQIETRGKKAKEKNVTAVVKKISGGYEIEAAFHWVKLAPMVHNTVGLEIFVREAKDDGTLLGTLAWADGSEVALENASVFGTIKLAAQETELPEQEEYFVETLTDSDEAQEDLPVEVEPDQEETQRGWLVALIVCLTALCIFFGCKFWRGIVK